MLSRPSSWLEGADKEENKDFLRPVRNGEFQMLGFLGPKPRYLLNELNEELDEDSKKVETQVY